MKYSVIRLGDDSAGCGMGTARYRFSVKKTSNMVEIFYRTVLQDPIEGHDVGAKPGFRARVFDEYGNIICDQVDLTSEVGQIAKGEYHPDWERLDNSSSKVKKFLSPEKVDLNADLVVQRRWLSIVISLDQYIGKHVTLEVSGFDCSQTGHMMRAYVAFDFHSIHLTKTRDHSCLDTSAIVLGISQPVNSIRWETGSSSSSIQVYRPGKYSAVVEIGKEAPCSLLLTVEVLPDSMIRSLITIPNKTRLCFGETYSLGNSIVMMQEPRPKFYIHWSDSLIQDNANHARSFQHGGKFYGYVFLEFAACLEKDTIEVLVAPALAGNASAKTECYDPFETHSAVPVVINISPKEACIFNQVDFSITDQKTCICQRNYKVRDNYHHFLEWEHEYEVVYTLRDTILGCSGTDTMVIVMPPATMAGMYHEQVCTPDSAIIYSFKNTSVNARSTSTNWHQYDDHKILDWDQPGFPTLVQFFNSVIYDSLMVTAEPVHPLGCKSSKAYNLTFEVPKHQKLLEQIYPTDLREFEKK
ncbi:MAG: hypothetical protein JNM00_05420 [Flavobacteriales bacterium]|nr:hypothetical protein [Flavobacteriales bacterium]